MTDRLEPPINGVTVRMYRIGHGDCFLLAFPRDGGGNPVYILIDCGRKPGSQNLFNEKSANKKSFGKFAEHIGAATNNQLDLVIITHEHQDHVNGFWKKAKPYFEDIAINECWLAWTEDPEDDLANGIRERHKDQLLLLAKARHQLAAFGLGDDDPFVSQLNSFLSLEFGGEDETFSFEAFEAAALNPSNSSNKMAMKLIKDKAGENLGVKYLTPGGAPKPINGTAGIRAFVLGPPRSEALIFDEDPREGEGFPDTEDGSHGLTFAAAIGTASANRAAPFRRRYLIPLEEARKESFFIQHYGHGDLGEDDTDKGKVASNAPFRRIDTDWVSAAMRIALKHNKGVNNTSLVLAFELPNTKKVLLFAADAQRGSWVSWSDQTWDDSGTKVSAKDLLARTVLYKVGHHGSHNATLSGQVDSDYANLSWMGKGNFEKEFTAMITAVSKWAEEKNNPPWRHPLLAIKQALIEKAKGRVFQTDTNDLVKPQDVPDEEWVTFLERCEFDDLYFDYTIFDE